MATATGFSYPIVKDVVSQVTAEPEQERQSQQTPTITAPTGVQAMNLNELVAITRKELGNDWYKIAAAPASDATSPVEMRISLEKSMAPTKQVTWSMNPYSGEIIAKSGWDQLSTTGKANQVIRRLHTGEFYGFIGQTIAGLVSLFACIMVYTGLALAWRRLISPLLKKRRAAN